jgi:hypothetical protein
VNDGSQLKLPLVPASARLRRPATLPYQRREILLSPAEITYYRMIQMIYGDRFLIMTHVRLSDLCDVVDRDFNPSAASRIDKKHVSFVLCDPKTFQPALAIELDSNDDRADPRRRDSFLDEVFRVIGLSLVRQRSRREYTIAEVTELVDTAIAAPA